MGTSKGMIGGFRLNQVVRMGTMASRGSTNGRCRLKVERAKYLGDVGPDYLVDLVNLIGNEYFNGEQVGLLGLCNSQFTGGTE